MKKSIFLCISIFVLGVFTLVPYAELIRAEESVAESILVVEKKSPGFYPDFIRTLGPIVKDAYENHQGFWEAEFEHEIVMVYIPAGVFQRSRKNGSVESVYLEGYWISKYEVTFDQYDEYCYENGIEIPHDEGWGRGTRPVINISWNEAMDYCRWLSQKTGCNFKLLTGAQWEKAARGDKIRTFPWGETNPSGNHANFADIRTDFKWQSKGIDDKSKYTSPVGSYPEGSSPYGVMDMAGNVYEWSLDPFSTSFSSSKGKIRENENIDRLIKGGSWYGSTRSMRTDFRNAAKSSSRYFHIGFRLCMK